MHWGHAVSGDLLHWTELGEALYPWSDAKAMAFSGSAVHDIDNTAGFGAGALVAVFTDTGTGEALAFSTDAGRSWTMYPGNPVVKHTGRDPRVFWHAPTGRWVMAVYDEQPGHAKRDGFIAFYSSPDLKSWTFESRIGGFYECPELFELPVTGGDANATRWVLFAADGKYLTGEFDGRIFTPHTPDKHTLWHGDFYAAQTFNDAPNGRRILIGWNRGAKFPGLPFNGQMTVPMTLSLRSTPDGVRMVAVPVTELSDLRGQVVRLADQSLTEMPRSLDLPGEPFDITAEFAPGNAEACGLRVGDIEVLYDARRGTVTTAGVTAPLASTEGHVRLRILLDRGGVEVFAGAGRAILSKGMTVPPGVRTLEAFAQGGTATLVRLEAWTLEASQTSP